MSAHTPGPWEAVLPDDPRGQPVPYYRGLIALVSKDPPVSVVTKHDTTSWSEDWMANARLIAAAPELLSIVERWLEEWHDTYDGQCISMCMVRVIDDAEAAVKKAKGEA